MRLIGIATTASVFIGVAVGGLFLSGALTSRAVQNPSISLDMVSTGNTYSDPGIGGNNSMAVGAIDKCFNETLALPRTRQFDLIVQNVERSS